MTEPVSERTEGDHQGSLSILKRMATGHSALELEDIMRKQMIDLVTEPKIKLFPYVRESLVHACAGAGFKHGTQ